MKWIKASERLPEDWSKVLVREIGNVHSFAPMYKLSHKNDLLILDAIGKPIKDFPLKFVEWLDESEDCFDDVPEFVKHSDQEELKKQIAKNGAKHIDDVMRVLKEDPNVDDYIKNYKSTEEYFCELIDKDGSLMRGIVYSLESYLEK